jgi:hypothetical protein
MTIVSTSEKYSILLETVEKKINRPSNLLLHSRMHLMFIKLAKRFTVAA